MHIRFDRPNRLMQQFSYFTITQFFEIITTYRYTILLRELREKCFQFTQVFPVLQGLLRLLTPIVLYFEERTLF